MNLFLIPDEVCESIEVQMNRYWWGHGQGNGGIRWKAWGKMCVTKEAGGLGFRKFKEFNISMLAKQGWRLINNVNPLVTSCIKAKYYPKGDFFTAKLGDNPSYMWRSILAAQEVLKSGCRKRIGNGQQTDIWKVPWLPCEQNGFMTTEMPMYLEGIKVCNLMQVDQQKWDEEVLMDICNERDRKLIRKIPLSIRGGDDMWFWHLDDKGEFTVRSCYRKLQGEIEDPDKMLWRKLWSLKLPGKVIHFMWRVCSLCLPTATRLAEKRVQINTVCQWCRLCHETDVHVLFECEMAGRVWIELGLQNSIHIMNEDNAFDVIRRLFDRCNREQCTLVVLACWSIWNGRNRWVWDKIRPSSFGIKATAMNMLREWKKAQEELMKTDSSIAASIPIRRWERPPTDWIKINIDAALFESIDCIGLGSVVRGSEGQFIMARSMKIEGLIPPREAEAMCLKEALSWLKNKNFKKCYFETDSQVLARAIKGVDGRSYFDTIVRDCIELCKHFDQVLVCFAFRSANGAAHALARAAYSLTDFQEWHENAPDFLHSVIVSESL